MILPLVAALALAADGGPVSTGSIPKQALQDVIRAHMDDVKACYLPLRGPDAGGMPPKVVLSFEIAPDGTVARAWVDPGPYPQSLGDCLSGKAKAWVFPRPTGGSVTVHYPIMISLPH